MTKKINNLLVGWAVHFSLIVAVMNLFYIIRYLNGGPSVRRTPLEYFVKHTFHDVDTLILLISLLFVEVNYQYVFRRFRLLVFAGACLVVSLLVFVTFYGFHYGNENRHLDVDLILIISSYGLTYAIVRNYVFQLSNRKDIQLQQAQSELNALKAQIHPHFLFNCLNYLYGTALFEKAQDTAHGIDRLSNLLRYTITGIHKNFVSVEGEFKFIDDYLNLQMARLPKSENIKIVIEMPIAFPDVQIAPLILLPFIENAFKYGINIDEECFIHLKMVITDNTLMLEIKNSIVNSPIEISGNHIGIRNTIKRLALLYPDKYVLKQTRDDHNYEVVLKLVLHP